MRVFNFFTGSSPKNPNRSRHDELPLIGEVFSLERLQTFASELASTHRISPGIIRGRDLLDRLNENRRELIAVYNSLNEAVGTDRQLTPAAEWLIDNFHIVEEQLREVRQDLPQSYYKQLPKLNSGIFSGYPRVYHLAFEIITHTDNRLDKQTMAAFLDAYQQQMPLTIGELWAFPISLRLALIDNLRRFAVATAHALADRKRANQMIENWSQVTDEDFADELAAFSKMISGKVFKENWTPAFVVQLGKKLRDGNRFMGFALETIEKKMLREGQTLEHLTHQEHTRQAASQISVANIITSMRLLSTLDWRDFFESVSLVDRTLRKDPARAYAEMDFKTRDLYRHQIERIAKQAKADEIDVAARAIELAKKGSKKEADVESSRRSHVGFFLISPSGQTELERLFNYRLTFGEKSVRYLRRHPTFFFLSAIFFLTILITASFVLLSLRFPDTSLDIFSLALLILGVLAALIPASELGTALTNRLINLVLKPQPLPKMDFQKAIPARARTMVVIPTLLIDEETIIDLCDRLEIYHLANRDDQLYFALLGDLVDTADENSQEDEQLRNTAEARIAGLNQKYAGAEAPDRFFFFSRKRIWSEGERNWISRERKRGNLEEFNRLLRGARKTEFVFPQRIDHSFLKTIRYVITLDADTQLPRDAARKLIGTIEHPLNRPHFDTTTRRVTSGYGIIQPRIEVDLMSGLRTPFAQILSEAKGFDPYTTAVSDVYQDLFEEGNYVGKGLYSVDAFSAALENRIPENNLLSHDLFEGLFARVGLAADIVLYDDYPSSYEPFARRSHRWTRGDWQIARWLLPSVPAANRKIVRNDLSLIARWKIFDNLRRSLLAPTLVVCLILGWTVSGISPVVSTLFVLVIVTAQLYLQIASTRFFETERGFWENLRAQLYTLATDIKINTAQIILRIVFLTHEASIMCDAVVRALYRHTISKRSLLQWLPAAKADIQSKGSVTHYVRYMFASPMIAMAVLILIIFFAPQNLIIASPFLVLWTIAPLIAFWISRRPSEVKQKKDLTQEEKVKLRLLARRTWRYFETFVGQSDHWLPPDNFQEDPTPTIAHRTSPTNIGLFLLATIATRDFGYTGTLETIERIELTCSTLERLPRFQGHFYNWYDTHTLEPLNPPYISTVDSGNLAGHLIAIAQACREMEQTPLFDDRTISGCLDTLALLQIETEKLEKDSSAERSTLKRIQTEIEKCRTILSENDQQNSAAWKSVLDGLAEQSALISDSVTAIAQKDEQSVSNLSFWAVTLDNLVGNFRRDLETLSPVQISPEIRSRAEEARKNLNSRLESIANFCRRIVDEMDFAFLYDRERKVLTIGYRPAENVSDNSYYDLLASEARLASFIAIATGDIAQEHWFRLGRNLVTANGRRALVSWSGTMFEYLMPLLVMRDFPRTLLAETSASIVRDQILYGDQHKLPWGVSESAYNARDLQLNYQYGPFGVPGLGLKRGLADDMVVAPYATVLAAHLEPKAAVANLCRLEAEGMLGKYGFYEAVDYTKERIPPGQPHAKIEAYMTHHQGMILVAIDNVLNDLVMQKRFHRDPMVESAELLLQERVPRQVEAVTHPRAADVVSGRRAPSALAAPAPRRYYSAEEFSPRICLLSNGGYSVMLTTAGSGFSRCNGRAVSRWREDSVRDNWGQFCYVRDVRSGAIWSTGFQPTLRQPQEYEVMFTESKADFLRRDAGILTRTEIIVSPEDDAELRKATLTNESSRPREIELTSYAEIVLNTQPADEAHIAFNNLFIETEVIDEKNIIVARRRPRSSEESEIWSAHTISVSGEIVDEIMAETDRARFIGRGGTTQNPQFLTTAIRSENEPSLDSIFSLRVRLLIKPGESATVTYSTIVAATREEVVELAAKYQGSGAFERSMKLAWTRSQVELRYLGVTPHEANLFQRLAGQLIFSDVALRPRSEILRLNSGTQKELWKYGLSGDVPILLVRVSDTGDVIRNIRQLVRAHEYLRTKNIIFDLLILNDQPVSYAQSFGDDLHSILRSRSAEAQMIDKAGGVFLRRSDIMPEADRILVHTAARACFVTERGSLEEQLARRVKTGTLPPQFVPHETPRAYEKVTKSPKNLTFPNEFGGFSSETNEYVINLETAEKLPPAPWANVIANEGDFGFLVTESGSGVTWSQNSRENRLTPWSNDAICDTPGECVYLRDEMTGSFWSPTALPIRENSPYTVRHGQGYSIFEHTSHGIEQELLVFAPVKGSVKISRLRLKNLSGRKRRLSVTHYCELTLEVERANSTPFIITAIDAPTGAIFARNPYNNEFAGRVAFTATDAESRTWTCDRREFLGRNGTLARPAAMLRTDLSGATGAGLDSCSALQTIFELEPDETKEIVFLLGEEDSAESARRTVFHFRRAAVVEEEFRRVRGFWDDLLSTIQVKTPDAATDLLMNRWLIYQSLACRFWARTSIYQASGAFGYRDQLQDAMALIYSWPELTRNHLLRAASRQFKEGDVQHWWHEPTGRGTRTRSSDDLLWLPYVACFYLKVTGDSSVFDEIVPFIEAPLLGEDQDEAYLEPIVSLEEASLYEHCIRAIERTLKNGEHGLPLIGSGDWSDGMTRVGNQGKGESIWLGWFLTTILDDFSKICQKREDLTLARRYRSHSRLLKKNLDAFGWDGDWYLRAFFDDGTPLGSHESDECKIDAIAQSWSVISGAGDAKKARRAIRAVDEHLIDKDSKLSLLLTPPFDKTPLDPGYIKGYQPGVRENGGHYTHAAAWNVIAFAQLGEGEKAFGLFEYLNPIKHIHQPDGVGIYKTEPYAVAADIYAGKYVGRGGWTWYTGAAGWMYRAMLEYILGFKKHGTRLFIEPCIPPGWPEFQIDYRYGSSFYQITIENPDGVSSGVSEIEIDGKPLGKNRIVLKDDGRTYQVRVIMGNMNSATRATEQAVVEIEEY